MKLSKWPVMPLIAFLTIYLALSGYTASTAQAASNFASIDVGGAVSLRNCDCSQDLYNCSDFASQGDAQACYWTCGAQNRGDVHKLDLDVNMVACDTGSVQPPSQPSSPATSPPPANPPATNPPAVRPPLKAQGNLRNCNCSRDLYNCSDFASQDDAQACYWNCGAQNRGDVHKLDLDVNMIACDVEGLQTPVQSSSTSASDTHTHSGDTHSHTDATTHTHSGDRQSSDYLGSYSLSDSSFGTQVSVTVDEQAQTRTIVSNALPNHSVGQFPNPGNPNTISVQSKSWTLTTDPVYIGTATPIRETGVAINGVKFEPGTGESVTCESGETHRIEAIQDTTSLGLDFNNAHVQPTGEYHYHGISAMLVDIFNTGQDLVHVGFANDGHLIYYSKSGAYGSSYRLGTGTRGTNCAYNGGAPDNRIYVEFGSNKDGALTSDWDYIAGSGQLDECNGTTVDGQYIYLITNEYPYISRCLMGESTGQGGPPPGGGGAPGAGGPGAGGPPGGGGQGGPPNFADAAAQLGISEQALRDAIGGPPPDFEGAAATLGIPVEELQRALGQPPR